MTYRIAELVSSHMNESFRSAEKV